MHKTTRKLLAICAIAMLAASPTLAAEPSADPGPVRGVPDTATPALERLQMIRTSAESSDVLRLQQAYLNCDKKARNEVLDFDEAMFCTIFADELKQRAFGGDFGQLIAWWQRNKLAD